MVPGPCKPMAPSASCWALSWSPRPCGPSWRPPWMRSAPWTRGRFQRVPGWNGKIGNFPGKNGGNWVIYGETAESHDRCPHENGRGRWESGMFASEKHWMSTALSWFGMLTEPSSKWQYRNRWQSSSSQLQWLHLFWSHWDNSRHLTTSNMLLSGVEWQSHFYYPEFFHVFPRCSLISPPKSPVLTFANRPATAMVETQRRTWTNASPACESWPCLWRAMWRFCNPSSRRTPGMGHGGKQSVKPLVVFLVPPKISDIWYIWYIYDICDIWNASRFDPFFWFPYEFSWSYSMIWPLCEHCISVIHFCYTPQSTFNPNDITLTPH